MSGGRIREIDFHFLSPPFFLATQSIRTKAQQHALTHHTQLEAFDDRPENQINIWSLHAWLQTPNIVFVCKTTPLRKKKTQAILNIQK